MDDIIKQLIFNELLYRKPFEAINYGKSDSEDYIVEVVADLFKNNKLNFETLNAIAEVLFNVNEDRVSNGLETEPRPIEYFYKELRVYPYLIECIKWVLSNPQSFDDGTLIEWNKRLNGEKPTNGYRRNNLAPFREFNAETQITGHFHYLLDFEYIPEAMEKLISTIKELIKDCDKYSKKEYIDELARIKYRFLKIHPFSDGNGRTSRLLLNYLGLKKGILFDCNLNETNDSTPIFEADRLISYNLPDFAHSNKYITSYLRNLVESPEVSLNAENISLKSLQDFLKAICIDIPTINQNKPENPDNIK